MIKHVTVFLSGRQIAKVGQNNGIVGCILDANSYIIKIQVGFVVAFMTIVVCSE
jgi:hypothetical protein